MADAARPVNRRLRRARGLTRTSIRGGSIPPTKRKLPAMQNLELASKPSFLDRLYQLGYFCAYRLMRTYWRIRHPTTNGALVAIWSSGKVLLVRNSYVPY